MKRLTRKEIEQGLASMPMETILFGASQAKTKTLTAKQIEFAKQVALGESKSQSYGKAYKSKGNTRTKTRNGQKLTKNTAILTQIEAFKVALEAQKYQTPIHLRALAIHKITEKVLDPDCPPAQQLKALELLGKITEVGLFNEVKTHIHVSNPSEMREKLMESIKLAISNSQAIDVEAKDADSLLAELVGKDSNDDDVVSYVESNDDVDDETNSVKSDPVAIENGIVGDPLHPDTLFSDSLAEPDLHSTPHIQSP